MFITCWRHIVYCFDSHPLEYECLCVHACMVWMSLFLCVSGCTHVTHVHRDLKQHWKLVLTVNFECLSSSLLCTRLASFWKCSRLYHLSPGRRPTGLQTMDYYSIRALCEFVDPNSGFQPCEANTLPNIPSYIQCLFQSGVIYILPGPQFSWFLLSELFLLLLINQSKDSSLSAKKISSSYMPM